MVTTPEPTVVIEVKICLFNLVSGLQGCQILVCPGRHTVIWKDP